MKLYITINRCASDASCVGFNQKNSYQTVCDLFATLSTVFYSDEQVCTYYEVKFYVV